MNKAIPELQRLGAQYFTPGDLATFADEIDRLSGQAEVDFFQLVQRGNEINLEYAALTGLMLVDFTLKPTALQILLLNFSSISYVGMEMQKTPEGGRLDFNVYTNDASTNMRTGTALSTLTYTATTPETISMLRAYAGTIQLVMGRRR